MPKRRKTRRHGTTTRPPSSWGFVDPDLGFVEVVWLRDGEKCPTCEALGLDHEEDR